MSLLPERMLVLEFSKYFKIEFLFISIAIGLGYSFLYNISEPLAVLFGLVISLLVVLHLINFNKIAILQNQKKLLLEVRNTNLDIALQKSLNFNYPPPILRGWAATPDFIMEIFRLIKESDVKNIVELGSGSSTVYIGKFLNSLGSGSLISIDNSEEYGTKTKKLLEFHDIVNTTVLIYPLEKMNYKSETHLWYSIDQEFDRIDLLIVDGPPGDQGQSFRFMALPFFKQYLHSGSIVILDDADRFEERLMIQKWSDLYDDIEIEYLPTQKGTAIIRIL